MEPRSRTVLWLLIAPIVVLTIGNYTGQAMFFRWSETHPLLLLVIYPLNRTIVIVSSKIDPVLLITVVTTRRMLSDPLYYLIGRFYGDSAIRWLEKRMGDAGSVVALTEKWFKKARVPVVFTYPGPLVCTLAGVTRMNPFLFMTTNLVGTATIVTIVYKSGRVLASPVGSITGFISRYSIPLTVFSVCYTLGYLWYQRRRGKAPLESVAELESEIDSESGTTRTE